MTKATIKWCYWIAAIPFSLFLMVGPFWLTCEAIEYCFPFWAIGREYELRLFGSILSLPAWFFLFNISMKLCAKIEAWLQNEPTKNPDWLIEKIQADLKTVELTKNPLAVEGYKKELLELLKKHNVTPPANIQKLLAPTELEVKSTN